MKATLLRFLLRSLAALAALFASGDAAAQPRGAPVVYAAIGDSTAVGTGADDGGGGYAARLARKLEQSGLSVKFQLVAVSGANAGDLRRDQLPKVMSSRPNLVTIGVGINDVMQGRKLAEFARDLEIVADLVRRTKAIVVIQTIPDLTQSPSAKGAPASLGRRIEAFNATIARVAERHGFIVADVHAGSKRAFRDRPDELFSKDGFHPSGKGYALWADVVWPSVERAVVTPRVQARRPAPER